VNEESGDSGTGSERPPAAVFAVLWEAMTDVIGSAATATLIRRAAKRAATRRPELGGLLISRDQLEYRFEVPPAWTSTEGEGMEILCVLALELGPLLQGLTGDVLLRRLDAVPELKKCGWFTVEGKQ
jgi:hypothetical protein